MFKKGLLICVVPAILAFIATAEQTAHAEDAERALRWDDMPPVPQMSLPRSETPPPIDGVFREEDWEDAVAVSSLQRHGQNYHYPPTVVYLTYDDEYLYFAARCIKERPEWYGADNRFRNSQVFMDPSIELFFSPDEEPVTLYQICINSYGAIYDIRNVPHIGLTETGFNVDLELESTQTQEEWYLEGRMPISDLAPEGFSDGDRWLFNVARNWPQRAWVLRPGFYLDQQNMGGLHIREDAPALQWLDLYPVTEGRLDVEAAVKNLTEETEKYYLEAVVTGEDEEDVLARSTEEVTLEPGERRTVGLSSDDTFEGRRGHLELSCRSEDGQREFYQQFMRFDDRHAGSREQRRQALQEDVPPPREIDVSLRYGPTVNALETEVDVWFLRLAGAEAEKVLLKLYSEDQSEEVIAEEELTHFQHDLAISLFELPDDLPYGDYELEAVALDQQGEEVSRASSTFERPDLEDPEVNRERRFREGRILDWMDNDIGKHDKVLPPWTPVKVDGREVSVWGRTFSIGEDGLIEQVISRESPLLSQPMRLAMERQGGETVEVQSTRNSGVEPNVHASQASWSSELEAGELTGTISAKLEYDGLVKYELELQSDREVEMERLYLDIPLPETVAERYLIHTGVDTLGEDEGLLWESKRAVDDELMGTLVPYLWVGDFERGLTWTADSTRGWYEQPGESVVELRREGDNVHLRVYFVRGPAELNEVSAEFAVLPTPTKPNPDGWRNLGLTDEWRYMWFRGWYGIEEDDEDAPGTHSWEDPGESVYTDGVEEATSHNQRKLPLPYTNPQFTAQHPMPWAIDEIEPTPDLIGEEWANMPSRWGPVKPVEGYRDWKADVLAYWMELQGYPGYYVDEAYGADGPDINLLSGAGWFDRYGNLRGSYHGMNTREMIKRMYAITHQYGRDGRPFVMMHSSGFGLNPLWVSFSTVVNFGEGDWELNTPPRSLLDVISRNNMVFYSGKPLGYVSAFFGDRLGGDEEAVRRSRRYYHGDMLVHDMVPNSSHMYRDADHVREIKRRLGIGKPDVEFFGYWEEDRPLTTTGDEMLVSLYRRPQKTLLVAVNADREESARAEIDISPEKLYRIPGNWEAVNAETDEKLKAEGTKMEIELDPRDVKHIFIRSTE